MGLKLKQNCSHSGTVTVCTLWVDGSRDELKNVTESTKYVIPDAVRRVHHEVDISFRHTWRGRGRSSDGRSSDGRNSDRGRSCNCSSGFS